VVRPTACFWSSPEDVGELKSFSSCCGAMKRSSADAPLVGGGHGGPLVR
jgi:hypothetical protein